MTNVQVKIYLSIDQHGNYQAIGGSAINDKNEHTAIAIVEDGIKKEGVGVTTTTFKVNVQLPEPIIAAPEEKKNEE